MTDLLIQKHLEEIESLKHNDDKEYEDNIQENEENEDNIEEYYQKLQIINHHYPNTYNIPENITDLSFDECKELYKNIFLDLTKNVFSYDDLKRTVDFIIDKEFKITEEIFRNVFHYDQDSRCFSHIPSDHIKDFFTKVFVILYTDDRTPSDRKEELFDGFKMCDQMGQICTIL